MSNTTEIVEDNDPIIRKCYASIGTGSEKHLTPGAFTMPEFAMLRYLQMCLFEKIEGVDLIVLSYPDIVQVNVRSENKVGPASIHEFVQTVFTPERLKQMRSELGKPSYQLKIYCTLIGREYIDTDYEGEPSILIDDISINDEFLPLAAMMDYLQRHGLTLLPVIGQGKFEDAGAICLKPPESVLTSKPILGVIMRPEIDLYSRLGERIWAELDVADFENHNTRDAMQAILDSKPTISLCIGNPPVEVGNINFVKDDDDEWQLDFKGNATEAAEALFRIACQKFNSSEISKGAAVKTAQVMQDWIAGPTPEHARDAAWLANLLIAVMRCLHGSNFDEVTDEIKNWDILERAATRTLQPKQDFKPELVN